MAIIGDVQTTMEIEGVADAMMVDVANGDT